MNSIKTLLNTQFQTLTILFLSILMSLFLLAIRVKLHQSFFYLFLVWNTFLALIPFAITIYLRSKSDLGKLSFAFWFCIWLLFLPNAPYIVTDLLHLKWDSGSFAWLDVLVVISFALNGLVLFFLSVADMKELLVQFLPKKTLHVVFTLLFGLTAFGVYLGRFLRFNSWDILQHPETLLQNITRIIIRPNEHLEAWLFTLCFSTFLLVIYFVFEKLKKVD